MLGHGLPTSPPGEACPAGRAARGEGDAGISDQDQALVALPSWTASAGGLSSVTENVQVLGTVRFEVQSGAAGAEVSLRLSAGETSCDAATGLALRKAGV